MKLIVKIQLKYLKFKEYLKSLEQKKSNARAYLPYEEKFIALAHEYEIPSISKIKNYTKELDYEFMFDTFLSNIDFHKQYVSEMFPGKKYYNSVKELADDGYDIHYFFSQINNARIDSIKQSKTICVKRKADDKIFVGFIVPNASVNIGIEDYFFINNSIFAYYFNTKTIELDGSKNESTIEDILKYMENNAISDLHFQLLDEYTYYFTARFGQEIIRITDTPVNRDYVNKIYNQALIKIGKDSLSNPPEVSGLLKERLLSKDGILKDRTFRFHSMFDSKGNSQGRAVSIRRLMNYDEITQLGLKGLNYSKRAIELISKASEHSHGINLITGKTNSGKSTLLYCILSGLYNEGRRIKSIEAPVEVVAPYSQVDLTQTEDAEEKYKMTREIAIAGLLRQDPDVVLLQEIRTKDEVDDFIQLGLKGHLAYTTLHTGSVQETILRIMKSADDPRDIQQTLKLIITQELIGKKCQSCESYKSEGKKCEECNDMGIKGVIPIYEIAYFNDVGNKDLHKIPSLIKEGLVEYISKKDLAREYKQKNWIMQKDYDRIMAHEKDLANEF